MTLLERNPLEDLVGPAAPVQALRSTRAQHRCAVSTVGQHRPHALPATRRCEGTRAATDTWEAILEGAPRAPVGPSGGVPAFGTNYEMPPALEPDEPPPCEM
jgi:hypothetical protein